MNFLRVFCYRSTKAGLFFFAPFGKTGLLTEAADSVTTLKKEQKFKATGTGLHATSQSQLKGKYGSMTHQSFRPGGV
jgi:hypothetical protein